MMLYLVRQNGFDRDPPNLIKAMTTTFTTHNLSSPCSLCIIILVQSPQEDMVS